MSAPYARCLIAEASAIRQALRLAGFGSPTELNSAFRRGASCWLYRGHSSAMGGLAGVRGRCLSTAAAGTSLAATQRQPARSLMGSSILRQHRCLTASAAAGGGAEHDWAASRAPAQLRSLRLAPPPQLHRSSRFPLPLRAASGAWPQQPGQGPYHQQQDHQQQRDYSSQPPWWQFWAQPAATREPSNGTDGSDGGLRPPEPLPANNPSASVEVGGRRAGQGMRVTIAV